MKKFLKKVLVFSVAGAFASVDCFAFGGGGGHGGGHGGWGGHGHGHGGHGHGHGKGYHGKGHAADIGRGGGGGIVGSRKDTSKIEKAVQDKYTQRVNAAKSRLAGELTQWKDEYAKNQDLIGEMTQQIVAVAKEDKKPRSEVWADYFSSSIETGKLVFFRSPDTPTQKGLFITLVSKEQFQVLGDWTQHAALIVQYANETNGQALFVHLAMKEDKDLTWLGYNHVQEIDGLQMVLGNLVLPRKDKDTVPYSPFMTWCVDPTQSGWQRAYDTYQELWDNRGRKDCSYSTAGASYGPRTGLSAWWYGERNDWEGKHNCVTYASMLLEKFGVISEADLMGDELAVSSFKTQLARKLIMSDSNSGTLLSRGEDDFQGAGAKVHPWITMNVGRVIKELTEEEA